VIIVNLLEELLGLVLLVVPEPWCRCSPAQYLADGIHDLVDLLVGDDEWWTQRQVARWNWANDHALAQYLVSHSDDVDTIGNSDSPHGAITTHVDQ
jgi:hypothetical protein